MTLRENFEKLFPVPEGVDFSNELGLYVSSPKISWMYASIHNDKWQGFQAGHAAGLEDAAQIAEKRFIYGHSVAGPHFAGATAAAIRAMKS